MASSSFLFTNSLLQQCPKLCKFSIMAPQRGIDDISPATLISSFEGTTIKYLCLKGLKMPSKIDSPLNLDSAVCLAERLTLDLSSNLSVWFPYFRCILPNWSDLKIFCSKDGIQLWSDVLWANDLSHLRQLHVCLFIHEFCYLALVLLLICLRFQVPFFNSAIPI